MAEASRLVREAGLTTFQKTTFSANSWRREETGLFQNEGKCDWRTLTCESSLPLPGSGPSTCQPAPEDPAPSAPPQSFQPGSQTALPLAWPCHRLCDSEALSQGGSGIDVLPALNHLAQPPKATQGPKPSHGHKPRSLQGAAGRRARRR